MTAQLQQSAKHASLIAELGAGFENYGYEAAFHAYWNTVTDPVTANPIAQGPFNGRMFRWLEIALGVSGNNLPSLMNAYAVSKGAANWDALGDLGI